MELLEVKKQMGIKTNEYDEAISEIIATTISFFEAVFGFPIKRRKIEKIKEACYGVVKLNEMEPVVLRVYSPFNIEKEGFEFVQRGDRLRIESYYDGKMMVEMEAGWKEVPTAVYDLIMEWISNQVQIYINAGSMNITNMIKKFINICECFKK